MSLETELAANTAAIKELTAAINDSTIFKMESFKMEAKAAKLDPPPAAKKPKAAKPKAPAKPKAVAAAEPEAPAPVDDVWATQVKAKISELLAAKGGEAVTEVLSHFGAKKFSEVDAEPHVYEDLIKKIDALLAEAPAEDFLASEPAPAADPALTMEIVKKRVIDVANHPKLGRPAAFKLLQQHGLEKITLMKEDQFASVYVAANKLIASVK